MKKVLVVDNQISTCKLLEKFLNKNGYQVETTTFGHHAVDLINETFFNIIMTDYRLPDLEGKDFFGLVKKVSPKSLVIFMTSKVNLRNAVDVIRRGAYNYLSKPLNPDELLEILRESETIDDGSGRNTYPKPEMGSEKNPVQLDYVYGKSPAAKEMLYKVKKVGPTNFTVIIEGETGTGKESLARLIHYESERRKQPFVAVDCGSLSKEIAGSELFGHEKGAFTGAVSSKIGFFELADGGTIFLDEIANLSAEVQMKLLRALQEKVIRKVGGSKEIPIDVRIIAATNENLLDKSEDSGFREDLFYRLSEFVLNVPTLRERMEDLPLLINFFVEKTALELGRDKPELSDEVWECFETYFWPGNIRELKNAIRHACLFVSKDNKIYLDALPDRIALHSKRNFNPFLEVSNGNRTEINEESEDLKSTALMAESKKIKEVLKAVHFNKTKAAERLNIHRKTLYSKLKALNITY